jgi:hypothetical protein
VRPPANNNRATNRGLLPARRPTLVADGSHDVILWGFSESVRAAVGSLPAASETKFSLVGEICGSPLRSNGGRKLGLRDSVAALLPGSRACESVTGLTGETA